LDLNASHDVVLELVNIDQQAIDQIVQTGQSSQKNIAVDKVGESTSNQIVTEQMAELPKHKVPGKITRAVVASKIKMKQHRTPLLQPPTHKPVQISGMKEQLSGSIIKQRSLHKVDTTHSNSQPDAVDLNKIIMAVRNHLESYKFYPSSARRRGIEGHVDVGFKLIPHGVADQVSLLHSSGYTVLDHAALEAVYRAQPFPIGNGKYRFRLTFKRL